MVKLECYLCSSDLNTIFLKKKKRNLSHCFIDNFKYIYLHRVVFLSIISSSFTDNWSIHPQFWVVNLGQRCFVRTKTVFFLPRGTRMAQNNGLNRYLWLWDRSSGAYSSNSSYWMKIIEHNFFHLILLHLTRPLLV
jgi:hypothetical protein